MENFPLLLQGFQGIHGFLHRNGGIRPVNHVQVDIVRLEILKRTVTFPQNGIRRAAADIFPIHKFRAAFCDKIHVLPDAHGADYLAYIGFRHAAVVGRGGVNEIDAAFHRRADGVQPGFLRIVIPAGAPDSPGAQSDFRNHHVRISKFCVAHGSLLVLQSCRFFAGLGTGIRVSGSFVRGNPGAAFCKPVRTQKDTSVFPAGVLASRRPSR